MFVSNRTFPRYRLRNVNPLWSEVPAVRGGRHTCLMIIGDCYFETLLSASRLIKNIKKWPQIKPIKAVTLPVWSAHSGVAVEKRCFSPDWQRVPALLSAPVCFPSMAGAALRILRSAWWRGPWFWDCSGTCWCWPGSVPRPGRQPSPQDPGDKYG